MTVDPDDYVMRRARPMANGSVDVEVVDLAGKIVQVIIPFRLTGADDADRIIRTALHGRHRFYKPVT